MATEADATYPIYVVDAFTDKTFGGNPAAVIPFPAQGHGWLSDELLQKIAAENNLSETAFLVPDLEESSQPFYELRWFTPAKEVALCGHATLAASYVVATALDSRAEVITYRTRKSGIVTAKAKRDGDSSLQIELSFPTCMPEVEVKDDAQIQLASEAVGCPVKLLMYSSSDPNGNKMTVLESADAVKAVHPDLSKVASLTTGGEGLIVTARVTESDSEEYHGVDFVSRYFAPNAGIDEDPVTGSAHCLTTPYWIAKLGKSELVAKQISQRVGTLFVSQDGDRVLLRGNATLYLEGKIHL